MEGKDCRNTIQKIKIKKYLKSICSHPNAETIYENVKKEIPSITLATVYRNLNIMSDCGDILKFKVGNEYRFDGNCKNHQHFVCKKCVKVFDFFDDDSNDFLINKVVDKGFKVDKVDVIFYGICKDCLDKM
jgi:Fur family transcriptional regulator, peroxide stress response regulator